MDTTIVPTDRNGLQVLDFAECLDLLATVPVGRVAVSDRGIPLIVPVNHVVSGSSILFRTTPGSKLDAALMERPAAFEADDFDQATRTGWSVVVRGRIEILDDLREADIELAVPPPWSAHARDGAWIVIRADEVTGRRLLAVED